jgi:hypothetical protein
MSMFQTLRRSLQLCRVSNSPSILGLPRHDIQGTIVVVALLFSVVGALLLTSPAAANFIIYPGSGMGTSVIYSFDDGVGNLSTGGVPGIVRETSIIPAHPAALFGAPTISGDSMDFNPAGFGVFAQNGTMDISDGQLTFMVTAKPGQAVSNIRFKEAGAVSLLGLGNAATSASDHLSLYVDIQGVNGAGINAIHLGPADFVPQPTFIPKGSFNLAADGNLNLAPWSGKIDIDFAPILVAHGYKATDRVTKISVNLDNQLLAMSQAPIQGIGGTSALMDKKDFFIVTTNFPEPTSCLLAVIGFVGALFFVRRGA